MKALFDIFNEKIIVLSSQFSVIKFIMGERGTFLDHLEAYSRGAVSKKILVKCPRI